MKLTIHLQAGLPGQADDVFEVDGETLIKNGTRYDLSAVPEGGEATPEGDDHPFIGTITRTNSECYPTRWPESLNQCLNRNPNRTKPLWSKPAPLLRGEPHHEFQAQYPNSRRSCQKGQG